MGLGKPLSKRFEDLQKKINPEGFNHCHGENQNWWPPVRATSNPLTNAVIELPHSPFSCGWGDLFQSTFRNISLSQDLLLQE